MKIIRHTAPDMRQALRAIREQLGEDAVILSTKRTGGGVEVTAAIDFDATSLQQMSAPAPLTQTPAGPHMLAVAQQTHTASTPQFAGAPMTPASAAQHFAAGAMVPASAAQHFAAAPIPQGPAAPQLAGAPIALAGPQTPDAHAFAQTPMFAHPALPAHGPMATSAAAQAEERSPFEHIARELRGTGQPTPAPALTARVPAMTAHAPAPAFQPAAMAQTVGTPARAVTPAAFATAAAPMGTQQAPVASTTPAQAAPAAVAAHPSTASAAAAISEPAARPAAPPAAAADPMSTELKTLRRMLETQLAQLAWNDMTRRAPVHTEILRELTEIGISQDLADYLIKQLPDDVELAYARRFAISGLAQYLLVTGDRWLENGGRVALIGATGVGKTTTLAKLAVRWVLRHGPRDLALVSCDSVRIGAQDQMQALGQLLGAPVYTPENFETLPTLVSRLERYRLVLIDTPGSSLRDAQLSSRMTVLANSASHLETALVLGANTQAGSLEEAVKRFAPANPSCCLLTKVDEAASLGGALSVLIRSRLPISYMSEGQRVPEDLRPARALELVSTAVRLAKATGAAADEDLLRRRFGKIAHALT